MCVNDIVVAGAEPLFFLDYYATGKLDVDIAADVVRGIARGCELAGCALTGGETAEMPGMYSAGDYDLAGFAVGVVEKSRILQPDKVARRRRAARARLQRPALQRLLADPQGPRGQRRRSTRRSATSTLGDALLAPTRIYVKSLLALLAEVEVHALAHITGGGLTENLPRVLPDHSCAQIDRSSWALPAGIRLAAGQRPDQRRGDAAHLQLRHRHGGLRAGRACRAGHARCCRTRVKPSTGSARSPIVNARRPACATDDWKRCQTARGRADLGWRHQPAGH